MLVLFLCAAVALVVGDEDAGPRRFEDPPGDALARPTDPGAAAAFDTEAHALPDLIEVRIGGWQPEEPAFDLFSGEHLGQESQADFFRLDLVLTGLVNPPGDARPKTFDPFRFGPKPVYGFIEMDLDRDVQTGGELNAPQYRYVGNIARFGGVPADDRFRDRVALDASAFDGDITTPPFVDRSGEEFHLALLGGEFTRQDVEVIEGNADGIFEAGETWQVTAPFLHRAHGFEDFSFVNGGNYPGQYMPLTTVQFRHDPLSDQTTVSLVFPLTPEGAGRMRDEPAEPANFDPTDQTCVYEGLYDLQFSAQFIEKYPSGAPEEQIIRGWASHEPGEFLESHDWDITILLGTSYSESIVEGVYYVWSDAYPNVVRGDVTGDGEVGDGDIEEVEDFIEANDAADGESDGAVAIPGFAEDFSVFDVNHDGRVDGLDLLAGEADGDSDDDEDVDLWDFARLQSCFHAESLLDPACAGHDLDLTGEIDLDDLRLFGERFSGPQVR